MSIFKSQYADDPLYTRLVWFSTASANMTCVSSWTHVNSPIESRTTTQQKRGIPTLKRRWFSISDAWTVPLKTFAYNCAHALLRMRRVAASNRCLELLSTGEESRYARWTGRYGILHIGAVSFSAMSEVGMNIFGRMRMEAITSLPPILPCDGAILRAY